MVPHVGLGLHEADGLIAPVELRVECEQIERPVDVRPVQVAVTHLKVDDRMGSIRVVGPPSARTDTQRPFVGNCAEGVHSIPPVTVHSTRQEPLGVQREDQAFDGDAVQSSQAVVHE